MSKIRSIRGMNDVIPSDVRIWQSLENSIKSVFSSYGYEEIRLPLVEKAELFSRTVGESTEIVSKEMYTLEDKGGTEIALRPEGTASCVRACLENNLLRVDSPRLWYMGPMFRYERPQKGRSRQFHQASLEVYGIEDPHIDAEVMLVASNLWKELGMKDLINLEINSLGNEETRQKFKGLLQDFFEPFKNDLDDDSIRNLKENPLRILDSKSQEVRKILKDAPVITEHLDKDSELHFNKLKNILDLTGLSFTVNERLVRGLDYYNRSVFEWKTKELGSQNTICGGGRYDTLVEELGGSSCPAIGFSIGMERLVLLVKKLTNLLAKPNPRLDCFLICLEETAFSQAILCSEKIRENIPKINLKVNLESTSASSQFKRADKSEARIALILGAEELKNNTISIKDLREESPQVTLSLESAIKRLNGIFSI
tara:strand:- start:719 stop:1999 length:1281 start_codon:yes stop_codon:yes gene_type:complete